MAARRLLLCLLAVALVPVETSRAQLGLNCTISASAVNFGGYNVFTPTALDSSGSITVQCTAGVTVRVQLSRGSSSTFLPRTLRSGSDVVDYNLYSDAFVNVWGDGSAGTADVTSTVTLLSPATLPVYGRIPPLQNARVGSYSDSIVATVVF